MSDVTFLEKLDRRYAADKRYVSRASRDHRSDSTIDMTQFKLEHYAGMVSTIYIMTVNYYSIISIVCDREHLINIRPITLITQLCWTTQSIVKEYVVYIKIVRYPL